MEGFEKILMYKNPVLKKYDLQIGYFVFFEKEKQLMFRDANEKLHVIDRVALLSEDYGLNNFETKIPKPYLIGENGEIKEYGANVLYSFANSTDMNIIVFGVLHYLNMECSDPNARFERTDYSEFEKKRNSKNSNKRYFLAEDDREGNITIFLEGKDDGAGNIKIKVIGKDAQKDGNITLEMNGAFTINQINEKDEIQAQIIMDNTDGDEKIILIDKHKNMFKTQKDGTIIETPKIRIGKTETLKKIFDDLFTAIYNMTLKHPQGPTLPNPINWAEFNQIKKRVDNFM